MHFNLLKQTGLFSPEAGSQAVFAEKKLKNTNRKDYAQRILIGEGPNTCHWSELCSLVRIIVHSLCFSCALFWAEGGKKGPMWRIYEAPSSWIKPWVLFHKRRYAPFTNGTKCRITFPSEVSAFVTKPLFLAEPAIPKAQHYASVHKIHVFITGGKILEKLAQRRVHNLSSAKGSPHLNSFTFT